jgi:hypothetical protein
LDLYFKDAYEFLHERKGAEVVSPCPEQLCKCISSYRHTFRRESICGFSDIVNIRFQPLYVNPPCLCLRSCFCSSSSQDMAFLDFGQGDKIGVFITELWPHLRPGALVLVHSTLTNSLTRAWLESMREMANDVTSVFGSFATMSLREPHKMFQNSFSIFQKRDGFTEPILTKYP